MAQGLRDLCKRHALPSSRQVLREGLVADELSRLVRKSRAQLVVLGAISRSGLRRLFIGNTAERVIDEMPCDVLIVKPPQFKSRLPRRGRRAPVFVGPVPY
jgi:universal stress protein E